MKVEAVGVVGAGVMGIGLGQDLAQTGHERRAARDGFRAFAERESEEF